MSFEKNDGNLSDEQINELVNKISKGSRKTSTRSNKDVKKDINIEDIDLDQMDMNTKKAHVDLFSGLLDVYKIIGVLQSDSQDHIKRKCNEQLAKHHPDKMKALLAKVPESRRDDEKQRMMEQYKLVKEAYNILRDPEKRKYYDLQKKTMDSKNFVKQKSSFDEYIKLQESEINEQSRKNAENSFKLGFLDFDKKHEFKRHELDADPISAEMLNKKLTDIETIRSQQDAECSHKNLFEGRTFNPLEFNKAWEKRKIKEERRKGKHNSDKSVVLWDKIGASNDFGIGGVDNYTSIESDYGDLYSAQNYGTSQYASKLDDISEHSESDMDINSDEIDVSYVTGHNQNKGDVDKKFAEYMKAREHDDDFYKTRELGDSCWKDVLDNPMNISSQLGTMVGKEIRMLDQSKKKSVKTSTIDAYKQLMLDREKAGK